MKHELCHALVHEATLPQRTNKLLAALVATTRVQVSLQPLQERFMRISVLINFS
jgi:hypothetical protein